MGGLALGGGGTSSLPFLCSNACLASGSPSVTSLITSDLVRADGKSA